MDFNGLIRRDHIELDAALVMALDTAKPIDEVRELLDICQLALAVHMVAETRVLAFLRERGTHNALPMILSQLRSDHDRHQRALDRILEHEPRSGRWFAAIICLRDDLLAHCGRQERFRAELDAQLSLDERRDLATRFMVERLKVLTTTSPVETARRVHA